MCVVLLGCPDRPSRYAFQREAARENAKAQLLEARVKRLEAEARLVKAKVRLVKVRSEVRRIHNSPEKE